MAISDHADLRPGGSDPANSPFYDYPEKMQTHIPETDSSWAAYRTFVAALFCEGLLFAFSLSFGVFQDYYTNSSDIPHRYNATWIGVLATGLAYLGAPAVNRCCQKFSIPPHYYICVGWILCVAGLLSSAFLQDVNYFILTQGLLFGLGLLVIESPTLIIINSWFVKRRGLAYGVLYGVTDIFGVGWAFAASALLNGYGIKITFLAFTAICLVLPSIALCFLRKRSSEFDVDVTTTTEADMLDGVQEAVQTTVSVSKASRTPRRYYQHVTFYLFLATNVFQSFAFYLPFMYLPSYTTALGYSSSTGAIVLAVANIAQAFGEVGFGRLSDKVNVHSLIFCSALVASLSSFLLWSFASSLAYLIVFALLFGSFAAGFLALWPRMGTYFAEKDATMIYAFMSFGRGFGVIASGPISMALLGGSGPSRAEDPSLVRHDYRPIVLYVGACMAASAALGMLGWASSCWKARKQSLHEKTQTSV